MRLLTLLFFILAMPAAEWRLIAGVPLTLPIDSLAGSAALRLDVARDAVDEASWSDPPADDHGPAIDASALLNLRGQKSKSHSGRIRLNGQHVSKEEIEPDPAVSRKLLSA